MPFDLGKFRKKPAAKNSTHFSKEDVKVEGAAASQEDLASLFGRAAAGDIDAELIKNLTKTIKRSLKISRRGITISGQGLAELLLKIAPRIPVNQVEQLRDRSGGMSGESLAGYTVKRASRHSAAIGGLAGGLASAGALAPPTWILLPAEIIVETVLISAIEMKMVAELHEIYGRPIVGTPDERGEAILQAWSTRRGIDLKNLSPGGFGGSKGARTQLVHLIRRKLIARMARNVSSIAPMLIGAAAAAELNRRATRDLGDSIVRDLGKYPDAFIDARIVGENGPKPFKKDV